MRAPATAGARGLAVFVFPIAPLSFAEPFDGGGEVAGARCFLFRFRDPYKVIAALAGRERFPRGVGFGVLAQGRSEVRRHARDGLWGHRRTRAGGFAGVHERDSLLEVASQIAVGREVGWRGEAAEDAHRFAGLAEFFDQELLHLDMPEAEDGVRFEGGHLAQNRLAEHEGRHAPLERFGNVGRSGMDQLAEVAEDRLGEVGGLGNVGVEARIRGRGHEAKLARLLLLNEGKVTAPTARRGGQAHESVDEEVLKVRHLVSFAR